VTGILQGVVTVVLFFLILGLLVLIHELGHFVVARLARVRVLEFGIGFPPRAKVIRSSGETLYTLNWLPIGGFVKLEGEDGDAKGDPRSFSAQSLPVRLLILVAGVVMNLVLAIAIFAGITWLASPFVGVQFGNVQADSPAAAAGLKGGDAIVAVDGQRYQFLVGPSVLQALRDRAGQQVTLTVDTPGTTRRDVQVELRDTSEIDETHGALGISNLEGYFDGATTTNDLPTAVRVGVDETVRWTGLIVGGLGDLVGKVAEDPTAPPPVAGPIGIASQIGDVFFNAGPIMTLFVAGILSANLAVVNILPFPPLDGGRMLMITLKRIFGARISMRAEQLTYLVGFAFLFAFIIWVSGFDLVRTFGGAAPPPP
jgi:regulator of sigma E protease